MITGKEFEVIDHTADVGIVAYGATLPQAFSNAAKAMFSLITDLESVGESETRSIEVTASDQEGLLVAWLNELVYIFDTENILFRRFDIADLSDTHLRALAYGEKVDKTRHEIRIGIKAATYHMLKIEKDRDYRVQVLFDI